MAQETLHIALIQADLVWEKPEQNRQKFVSFFGQLPNNVDLVLLPEMFATGFSMNVNEFAETMDGASVSWMKEQAYAGQFVLAGSLMIKEKGYFFNRFIFAFPDGKIEYYNKRHLFSMGEEHLHFTAGTDRKIIEIVGFRVLPQICYDLRFPVFSRNRNDYDLLVNCANWPAPRQQVWDALLKARAIENQAYVAGVNRTGVDANGIRYEGGSIVVDPKGSSLTEVTSNEEIIIAKLNKPSLEKFRRNFPVLDDADVFFIK